MRVRVGWCEYALGTQKEGGNQSINQSSALLPPSQVNTTLLIPPSSIAPSPFHLPIRQASKARNSSHARIPLSPSTQILYFRPSRSSIRCILEYSTVCRPKGIARTGHRGGEEGAGTGRLEERGGREDKRYGDMK